MSPLTPVKIPQRLYAFAIDVALVAMMKITLLQGLSQYAKSILESMGNFSSLSNFEDKMTIFIFSLFPLLWVAYTSVSTYIFGSTFGSKAFGYHFARIENGQKFDLHFSQALQRSLIMLTCIYTWGVMALVTLFRDKQSKVVTDLVENVFAIYNDQEIETLQISYLPVKKNTDEHKDEDIAA